MCRFQYFASTISTICANSYVVRRDRRQRIPTEVNPPLTPIRAGPAFLAPTGDLHIRVQGVEGIGRADDDHHNPEIVR
jgi:hypothetical protein